MPDSPAYLQFREQIAAIERRTQNLVPTAQWTDVMRNEHDRAFMVAGAAKTDLLADFASAIEQVAKDGKSIEWFRANFDAIADKHGWAYSGERNWRTRVIYTTNLRSSYAAGRLAQLRDPELQQVAPYWMYRHGGSADPRPQHLAWHKRVIKGDDPWWKTHYPPNGWGCSCSVQAVSKRQAERLGGRFEPPEPDARGAIDDGWDYMPGDTVADELRNLVHSKQTRRPASLSQPLSSQLAQQQQRRALFDNPQFLGQRPGLYDLPDVLVTELSGEEFGQGLNSRDLGAAANQLLRRLQKGNGLYNDDTGWLLAINKNSRKKMGDNAEQSDAEIKSVAALNDLAMRAIAGERHADFDHQNPDILGLLRLFVPVEIDGDVYRVKLTVKDYGDRHVLHALEIERALPGILPSYSGPEGLQTAQPTTGRSVSIAQLMQGATLEDGSDYQP